MSAGMDGGGSTGSPSFMPDTVGALPSPFARLPRAGYREYLADFDDRWRTYQRMMTPGTKGRGLMVTAYNMYYCCHGENLQGATCDADGLVVLVPALVCWRSVVGEDGYLIHTVAEAWKEGLDFPPVGIIDTLFVDDWMSGSFLNTVHPDDRWGWDDDSTHELEEGSDPITSVVAPWQVLPITTEAYEAIDEHLRASRYRYDLNMLGMTNCELSEVMHEPAWDGDGLPDAYHGDYADKEEHTYHTGDGLCSCGQPPTILQVYEAVADYFTPARVADLLIPSTYRGLWLLAVQRYLKGWETIHSRAEIGDAWSTFCWRRLSPFWDSDSLAAQHRALSALSTPSATSQASPHESSQLSMPFAS